MPWQWMLVGHRGETSTLLHCRHLLTTRQLSPVLAQHPTLEALCLACCPRVSDRTRETLPAQSLKKLTLMSCDGVQGRCLSRLTSLEVLSVCYSKTITEEAIQVRACTGLCWSIVKTIAFFGSL